MITTSITGFCDNAKCHVVSIFQRKEGNKDSHLSLKIHPPVFNEFLKFKEFYKMAVIESVL